MTGWRWLGLLWAAVHASSFAGYDLGSMCQATGGWEVVEGRCDGQGRLQGPGKATRKRSGGVFSGNYVNGLPDGPQVITFCGTDKTCRTRKNPDVCRISFAAGTVTSSELSCTGKGATLQVKPGAGSLRWEAGDEGTPPTLTIDLPSFELKGDAIFQAILREGPIQGSRLTGSADHLELSLAFNPEWTLENAQTQWVSPVLDIDGVFTLNCRESVGNCKASAFTAKPDDARVDPRSLVKLTDKTGTRLKYELVFGNDRSGEVVLYLKSSEGLVFDAFGVEACRKSGRVGARLLDRVRQRSQQNPGGFNMDNDVTRMGGNFFEILPMCGKVATPDGRSFEGVFDEKGRPRLNR